MDRAEAAGLGRVAMVPEGLIGWHDRTTGKWIPAVRRRGGRPGLHENFRREATRVRAELLPWIELIERTARAYGKGGAVKGRLPALPADAFLDEAERQVSQAHGELSRILPCEQALHASILSSSGPTGSKPLKPPRLAGCTLTWMIREWLVARLMMRGDPELGDLTRASESVADIVIRRLYDEDRFPWMKVSGEPVWGLDPNKKQPLRDLLRPPSQKR
jgi:hypothetical protein